jgi:hypothetical protein
VKEQVVSQVNVEAEQYLGTAMTFTLFEFVKEKMEELLAGQPQNFVSDVTDSVGRITISRTQVKRLRHSSEQWHASVIYMRVMKTLAE